MKRTFKGILLSERNQAEKSTHFDSNYVRFWRIKTREQLRTSTVVRGIVGPQRIFRAVQLLRITV